MEDPDVIKLPCLGRPFKLGMLYDCRNDTLLQGSTAWEKSTLENCTLAKDEKSSECKTISVDSIDSKFDSLDIKGDHRLSCLSGLVEMSGSALYLNDHVTSGQQVRVTLKHKSTGRYESLDASQLKNEPFHTSGNEATHVVTGILYGKQSFFVFEKNLQRGDLKHVEDSDLMVKALMPRDISIARSELFCSDEEEKKKINEFQVKYFGDCQPSNIPNNYSEVQALLDELRDDGASNSGCDVPLTVWLYPLSFFDKNAHEQVHRINDDLVSKLVHFKEQIDMALTRCTACEDTPARSSFPGLIDTLRVFKAMVVEYDAVVTRWLLENLPKMRRGEVDESELRNFVLGREKSPFRQSCIKTWLDNFAERTRALDIHMNTLTGLQVAAETNPPPGDQQKHQYSICLTMQYKKDDQLLSVMESYLDHCRNHSFDQPSSSFEIGASDQDDRDLATRFKSFRDFASANTGTTNVTFDLGEAKVDTGSPGVFMNLYKDGELLDRNFRPPLKPSQPVEEATTHCSILLKWNSPEGGSYAATSYTVSYKDTCTNNWTTLETPDAVPTVTIQNLKPGTTYVVKVRSETEIGCTLFSDVRSVCTRSTSLPGKPNVGQASPLEIAIEWTQPEVIADGVVIRSYDIERAAEMDADKWEQCGFATNPGVALNARIPQEADTSYRYRIIAVCSQTSRSVPGEASDHVVIKASREEIVKERVRVMSFTVRGPKNPSIHQVHLEKYVVNDCCLVRKFTFGRPRFSVPEKIILIVGATGAGKTTFINGILNFILGVEWKDDFRFRLVEEDMASNQAKSQTKWITAYTLYHDDGFQFPYTLTIIDTPGFGDTSGIQRDKEITDQLRHFFTTPGQGGIDHIDAIGFVTQSSLPRLTPSQRYVFDSILSLFGKDIAGNIFLLVTFADGQTPPVLAGVKEADLPYQKYFKFNNSALFATNTCASNPTNTGSDSETDEDDNEGQFDEMFWSMGVSSYKRFLKQLTHVESKSLLLTKSVLNERHQLEAMITGIQKEIQTGLDTLETLKVEIGVLKTHRAEIERNKSFEYTVPEQQMVKVDIRRGQYTTNCLQCNYTCHFPCGIANDADKAGCWAMSNGKCRVCPMKCYWDIHHNLPYIFELKTNMVKKTSEDLRARYETAKGKSLSAEKLIEKVIGDFDTVQMNVLAMTNKLRETLNHLKEIALKPNPLSTVEYIDIMIQSEREQCRPGWKTRVDHLTIVRQQAETINRLASEGFDPFHRYEEILEEAGTVAPNVQDLGFVGRFKKGCKRAGKYLKGFLNK